MLGDVLVVALVDAKEEKAMGGHLIGGCTGLCCQNSVLRLSVLLRTVLSPMSKLWVRASRAGAPRRAY